MNRVFFFIDEKKKYSIEEKKVSEGVFQKYPICISGPSRLLSLPLDIFVFFYPTKNLAIKNSLAIRYSAF